MKLEDGGGREKQRIMIFGLKGGNLDTYVLVRVRERERVAGGERCNMVDCDNLRLSAYWIEDLLELHVSVCLGDTTR